MRTSLLCLSCFVAFALSNRAEAHVRVWHTAEALSPSASIEVQGDIDTLLRLGCDNALGNCQWRIRTQLQIENGTSSTYSIWLRDLAGGASTLHVSNTDRTGSIYDNTTFVGENMANGYASLIEAGHSPAISASGTVHFMHSFLLTDLGNAISGESLLKAGSNGFQGFEPQDPGDPFRRVTMNGITWLQAGFPSQEWPDEIIRITYVPEPESLGLLACGILLLPRVDFGGKRGKNRQ